MIKCLVLVKHLRSRSKELHFSNFKLVKIGSTGNYNLDNARKLFTRTVPVFGDWVYEMAYEGNTGNVGHAVEDHLLLLRLFKPGDISFLNLHIELENGEQSAQLPYPAVQEFPSRWKYSLEPKECATFDAFAKELISKRNFCSSWFQIVRRFFLYGGSKELNPQQNAIDRIVDYMTVLEAILVPENDGLIGARLKERAVELLKKHDVDIGGTKRLLSLFYNARSRAVHGGDVSSLAGDISVNSIDFEIVVRQIIIESIKAFPEINKERREYLKALYDPPDKNRAEAAFANFCHIKDEQVKRNFFKSISKRMNPPSDER